MYIDRGMRRLESTNTDSRPNRTNNLPIEPLSNKDYSFKEEDIINKYTASYILGRNINFNIYSNKDVLYASDGDMLFKIASEEDFVKFIEGNPEFTKWAYDECTKKAPEEVAKKVNKIIENVKNGKSGIDHGSEADASASKKQEIKTAVNPLTDWVNKNTKGFTDFMTFDPLSWESIKGYLYALENHVTVSQMKPEVENDLKKISSREDLSKYIKNFEDTARIEYPVSTDPKDPNNKRNNNTLKQIFDLLNSLINDKLTEFNNIDYAVTNIVNSYNTINVTDELNSIVISTWYIGGNSVYLINTLSNELSNAGVIDPDLTNIINEASMWVGTISTTASMKKTAEVSLDSKITDNMQIENIIKGEESENLKEIIEINEDMKNRGEEVTEQLEDRIENEIKNREDLSTSPADNNNNSVNREGTGQDMSQSNINYEERKASLKSLVMKRLGKSDESNFQYTDKMYYPSDAGNKAYPTTQPDSLEESWDKTRKKMEKGPDNQGRKFEDPTTEPWLPNLLDKILNKKDLDLKDSEIMYQMNTPGNDIKRGPGEDQKEDKLKKLKACLEKRRAFNEISNELNDEKKEINVQYYNKENSEPEVRVSPSKGRVVILTDDLCNIEQRIPELENMVKQYLQDGETFKREDIGSIEDESEKLSYAVYKINKMEKKAVVLEDNISEKVESQLDRITTRGKYPIDYDKVNDDIFNIYWLGSMARNIAKSEETVEELNSKYSPYEVVIHEGFVSLKLILSIEGKSIEEAGSQVNEFISTGANFQEDLENYSDNFRKISSSKSKRQADLDGFITKKNIEEVPLEEEYIDPEEVMNLLKAEFPDKLVIYPGHAEGVLVKRLNISYDDAWEISKSLSKMYPGVGDTIELRKDTSVFPNDPIKRISKRKILRIADDLNNTMINTDINNTDPNLNNTDPSLKQTIKDMKNQGKDPNQIVSDVSMTGKTPEEIQKALDEVNQEDNQLNNTAKKLRNKKAIYEDPLNKCKICGGEILDEGEFTSSKDICIECMVDGWTDKRRELFEDIDMDLARQSIMSMVDGGMKEYDMIDVVSSSFDLSENEASKLIVKVIDDFGKQDRDHNSFYRRNSRKRNYR